MMKKINLVEMLVVICVSYTILSLVNAGLALAMGKNTISAMNSFTMVLWTSIGVGILYMHQYFERWSPLVMIIAQYIIAMGLVFGSLLLESQYIELHPMAYRDAFRSFTIPYIIGAAIYYIYIFREAKRQNELLQEIKNKKS
ncbi:DUF6608 family protein [Oceanirhabdus seepicola]|uniref:Uncharacterized protein n=1 Tax=Oceanirhabdus seepicola TaxID=2828781 RepID=A0A9J6NZQ9_9CLOT|nr:DUF6608 family protein [Oceanirhabdus seepicola]MCM1989101.1 hypothetical protein [Oceanirhabdus seepicola]